MTKRILILLILLPLSWMSWKRASTLSEKEEVPLKYELVEISNVSWAHNKSWYVKKAGDRPQAHKLTWGDSTLLLPIELFPYYKDIDLYSYPANGYIEWRIFKQVSNKQDCCGSNVSREQIDRTSEENNKLRDERVQLLVSDKLIKIAFDYHNKGKNKEAFRGSDGKWSYIAEGLNGSVGEPVMLPSKRFPGFNFIAARNSKIYADKNDANGSHEHILYLAPVFDRVDPYVQGEFLEVNCLWGAGGMTPLKGHDPWCSIALPFDDYMYLNVIVPMSYLSQWPSFPEQVIKKIELFKEDKGLLSWFD